jgi:hypothetical protein
MKPDHAQDFHNLAAKNIALVGMSGVGKTHISKLLRGTADWFHYSVDYRIGSGYLASHIDDDLRRVAMTVAPFPDLLRADAIAVKAKFGIDNLDAMSAYLGQIGDPARNGMDRCAFLTRQAIHKRAEVAAMHDVRAFQSRARDILNYKHFVCDTSGSFCSVVNPDDPNDRILTKLSRDHVIVYIEGDDAHRNALIERFCARPKPIYYSDTFFEDSEVTYLNGVSPAKTWAEADPQDFAVWAFRRLIPFRLPRYRKIAQNWGYTIAAKDVADLSCAVGFMDLVADTIGRRNVA